MDDVTSVNIGGEERQVKVNQISPDGGSALIDVLGDDGKTSVLQTAVPLSSIKNYTPAAPTPAASQAPAVDALNAPIVPQQAPSSPMMAPGADRGVAAAPAVPPKPDPNAMYTVLGGAKQEAAGIQQTSDIEQQKYHAIANAQKQQMHLYDQQIQDNAKREAAKEQMLSQARKKEQDAVQAIKDFKPRDLWADAPVYAKIGAAIAMGMGAYSAAKLGGPNHAAEIIKNASEADARKQQMHFQQLKEGAENARSLYATVYRELGDKDLAALAVQKIQLEKAQTQVAALTTQYAGPEAMARGKELQGALGTKVGEINQQFQIKTNEAMIKKAETFVPATGTFAPSAEAAKKVNDFAAIHGQATSTINALTDLSNTKYSSITPELKARAQALQAGLVGAVNDGIIDTKRLGDADKKLLDRLIARPTDILSLDANERVKLKTLQELMDAKLNETAKANGALPYIKERAR